MAANAPPPTDEELACRSQTGCMESFEQLLQRYQAPVLHFLRCWGNFADAEDLLQETFVRAYINLHRYRPRWRFSTWLFTIARRVSINHHRQARTTGEGNGQALAEVACSRSDPAAAAAAADARDGLWAAAARLLSEEQLTALWLYYVEELSTREIGRVLGRSSVSVKTMLFRARKKLLPLARATERFSDASPR